MDNADFFAFQQLIHEQRLLLLRHVYSITSHEGPESLGQDLRLWSVGEGQVDVTLMFYTNVTNGRSIFERIVSPPHSSKILDCLSWACYLTAYDLHSGLFQAIGRSVKAA